ncbi:hypothetical protein NCLIV_018020 [Neospora caninum Liverpool]|uniref:Myosin motor domain-containing protein n=1 Tax=Neospora caninum (strain Liverpool) TaxID=572307 RepID=F0VE68_NEOCL|nr:hypothetical protein NCLIV_018020 [Neospora caninum Liverpool]CBZ52012.1 hypothetical protein NCLIV_018020 [Neospora caninum Liverpool]|eukprot:XP_003882044.1 hypothetical protein NCLIV_018020 [Neospora caninum Liverpool]
MPPKKAAEGGGAKKKVERKYSAVELGDYLLGSPVFVREPSKEEMYVKAIVKSISGTQLTVDIDGNTKTVEVAECLNANVGIDPVTVVDLAKLPHANEACALEVMRERYVRDQIYTYAGRLLVAMNPFKLIPGLYEPATVTKYQNADTSRGFPTDVPPHTYAVAQTAMDMLKMTKENQSCVVSGESGAGKTETARQLMQYFATSKSGTGGDKIQEIILGANPLLEAIGNAKTLRNNNSSRFGRFVSLDVAPTGGIHGGIVSNYMLELSRIEFQGQGERSYHIFYQMIKGLQPDEKQKCALKEAPQYEFLNKSGCYEVETVNDLKEFAEVRQQLKLLFSPEEELDYFKCLSAVILAGNIKYKNTQAMGTDKAGKVVNDDDFQMIASLLGADAAALNEAVTINIVEVQGNVIKSPLSADQATVMIRSMAKELYNTLFDYIVKSVNKQIQFDAESKPWIGILDIYGFEFFQKNSYEQYLINYANERLQQFFIQQVFQAEKVEYEAEGIDHSMIVYSDNATVLEVFDKPKAGIFAYLEEQCLIQTGSSESFTAACHKNIKNPCFQIPKGDARLSFLIVHTAAPVTYDTTEFVPKNKMRLPNELLVVFKSAKNLCMKNAFADIEIPDTKNMRGKFVGSKFQKSMTGLMTTLKSSHAHFGRCIKPNQVKKPQVFETETTLGQMISLSVLEAVAIIHKGFAYRASFQDFVQDNNVLMSVLGAKVEGSDMKQACITMLDRLAIPKEEYQLGNTKIFLRKTGWLMIDKHFRTVMANLKPLILKLQSIYRAYKARVLYTSFSRRVVRIQALMRRYELRKSALQKKIGCRIFAGSIFLGMFCQSQKELRQVKARMLMKKAAAIGYAGIGGIRWKQFMISHRMIRAAVKIQSHWRRHAAQKLAKKLSYEKMRNNAATDIQRVWRGYLGRLRVQLMRLLTPYAITIQRFWRGYRTRSSAMYRTHAKIFDGIRRGFLEDQGRVVIQSCMRRYIVLSRLQNVTQAAYSMQKFAQAKLLRMYVSNVHAATLTIQAWWRGNRVRRILQEEKLKLVLAGHLMRAEKQTLQECQQAVVLLRDRERCGKRLKSWQLIHVNVSVERDDVYPKGWATGIRTVESFNPAADLSHIELGAFHTVVATSSGYVYTYGLNDRGQLSVGASSVSGLPLPMQPITGLLFPIKIKQVSCGVDHTLLLDGDGRVFAWGSNQYGQCGCAPRQEVVPEASEVHFASTRGASTPMARRAITMLSAGAYHNAAIDDKGRVYMWGRGDHIYIRGVFSDVPLPLWITHDSIVDIGPLDSVECGLGFTYLLAKDGTVYVFGQAINGQLGLGSKHRRSRVAVPIENIEERVTSISCGVHTTLAVTPSGTVYQWGVFLLWDTNSQVCVKAQSFVPMSVDLRRGGITGVAIDVKVGWWEGVVLTSDGLLWAWNFFDQPSEDVLRPAVYQYVLTEGQIVRAVHVVSSPLFSAVFSKLEEDKAAEKMRGSAAAPSAVRTRPSVNPHWDPLAYNKVSTMHLFR